MKKKRLALALVLIIIVFVSFFSYFAYVANNEKTAMDHLSFTVISASFGSITLDAINRDVTGSVVVSMRFINPIGIDTPTFSVGFTWFISPSASANDGEYCGTGNLESVKIPSDNFRDSTFTLPFSLRRTPLELFNAIQAGEVNIILGGAGRATILFGLIPASKPFLESKRVDK